MKHAIGNIVLVVVGCCLVVWYVIAFPFRLIHALRNPEPDITELADAERDLILTLELWRDGAIRTRERDRICDHIMLGIMPSEHDNQR